jgi:hypothetical protein
VPRELLLVLLAPVLLLLPFVEKAVHIDDPLFIWTAQRILTHPLDFYGFHLNWYGTAMPMYEVNQNPPLTGYYLAIAGALFGWREATLHLAMMLPAALAGVGVYLLSRHFCRQSMSAALIAIVTPAFLVSSTTLMSDMLLLMFFVWAIVFWLEGLSRRQYRWLIVSGIAIGLAALSKYFGACLIPLLLAHSLTAGKGNRRAVCFLLLPLLLIAAYEYATFHLYGRGLLLDAVRYASAVKTDFVPDYGRRAFVTAAFLGACLAPLLFYAGYLWRRRGWIVGLVIASAGALSYAIVLDRDAAPALALQVGLWLAVGIGAMQLAVSDLLRHKDARALLLFLWTAGTLLFVVFFNHLVNVRVLLPLVPAVAILIVRRIEDAGEVSSRYRRPVPAWPIVPAVVLALCVAYADMSLANASRRAAAEVPVDRASPVKTWFGGHWGFQYYMELRGAEAVNTAVPLFRPGDLVALPRNTTNPIALPEHIVAERSPMEVDILPWLATMQSELGAGFYADVWGPLPFVFAPVPPEQYQIVVLGVPREI